MEKNIDNYVGLEALDESGDLWAVQMAVATESPDEFIAGFESASEVAGARVRAELIDPSGPSGGWPEIRFIGPFEFIRRWCSTHYDDESIMSWTQDQI